MESGSEWRVIDAADEEAAKQATSAVAESEERVPRWLIGAAVAVIGVACALAIWMTLPSGGVAVEATDAGFGPRGVVGALGTARPSLVAGAVVGQAIVVDIEGAVGAPGIHQLADGSRVGDAIAAAGGYAPNVDIEAAQRSLNLAAKLTDGQQIRVPALGDAATVSTAPGGGGGDVGGGEPSAPGALIDLNHATADELDTLPGIGPVTAAKIIDARTQAPFATVDELQSRGVVGPSTFEKLRDLVTVTP